MRMGLDTERTAKRTARSKLFSYIFKLEDIINKEVSFLAFLGFFEGGEGGCDF